MDKPPHMIITSEIEHLKLNISQHTKNIIDGTRYELYQHSMVGDSNKVTMIL